MSSARQHHVLTEHQEQQKLENKKVLYEEQFQLPINRLSTEIVPLVLDPGQHVLYLDGIGLGAVISEAPAGMAN